MVVVKWDPPSIKTPNLEVLDCVAVISDDIGDGSLWVLQHEAQ